MEENLRAAAEEEKSDSEESSSSSSSNSSSSSGIGLKQGQKAAKAKAKRKSAASASKQKPSQPVPGESEAAKKEQGEKGGKGEKSEKHPSAATVLQKSKAALDSLIEVQSWSVWTNSIKAKDVDMRVNKGLDYASKCEKFPGEPEFAEILAKLNEEVNRVSQESEVLNQLASNKDIPSVLLNRKDDVIAIVLQWKADEMTSFLNDIGRKLCETMISSNGSVTSFFSFISTAPGEWTGFGLASLMASQKDKEFTPCIAQSQQSLVNCFLDRFRTMGAGTEAMLKAIPLAWFLPDICRTPLVPFRAMSACHFQGLLSSFPNP